REFPVDPANEAGFDNSAESLAMSPALVKEYLGAARPVAAHPLLNPDGLAFAPQPIPAETDPGKSSVKAIIDFFTSQKTDSTHYSFAASRYRHRAALGRLDATQDQFADELGLSRKYLATIRATLDGPPEEVGPIAALQRMWRELPEPRDTNAEVARADCDRMR